MLKPKHLLGDRSYESQANHKLLAKRGIAPIIHNRKAVVADKLYDASSDRRGRPVCGDGNAPC